MKISQDKVVALTYELRLSHAEGDFVEAATAQDPLVFLFGAGQMIPDFEGNLEGLSVGDTFAFGIVSENAYGPTDADAIVDLPREIFQGSEDLLIVDNVIPMRDDMGNMLQGRVLHVGLENIKMDFNHPMAGKDLYFRGEILDIRQATPEEIDHGHVHGPDGHHHH